MTPFENFKRRLSHKLYYEGRILSSLSHTFDYPFLWPVPHICVHTIWCSLLFWDSCFKICLPAALCHADLSVICSYIMTLPCYEWKIKYSFYAFIWVLRVVLFKIVYAVLGMIINQIHFFCWNIPPLQILIWINLRTLPQTSSKSYPKTSSII